MGLAAMNYSMEKTKKRYWIVTSTQEKRLFIVSQKNKVPQKRSRKREYDKNVTRRERGNSFKYTFLDPKCAEEEIQVCLKVFLNTLSISKTKIQTSFLKRTASGTVKQDERERHKKHNRVERIRKGRVMSHLKMFKVTESHYMRKYETYQYLAQELNIK